jgi:hypothetical protein
MENRTYVYEPLENPEAQIRLVTIEPGREGQELSCALETKELNDNPIYEALSYCWDAEVDLKAIKLHGADLEVTPNLFDALLALRRNDRPRTMWIDALCINQHDSSEKGHQVPLMGKIFSSASQTIAWIGKENEVHREGKFILEAIKLMHEVGSLYKML